MTRRPLDFTGVRLGPYLFQQRLGEGAFASVWLASELDTGMKELQKVAIKVFTATQDEHQRYTDTWDDYRREIAVLMTLATHHPVVQYFGSRVDNIYVDPDHAVWTLTSRPTDASAQGEPRKALLVIMEVADAGCLGSDYRNEVIKGHTDSRFLKHFIDVCLGLKAAHEKNIVHRDIKPSNLMWFRQEDHVRVGDFGIALDLSKPHDPSWYLAGSLPYMSPESFEHSIQPSPARDVYALGCTFYELITGACAFDSRQLVPRGGSDPEIIAAYKRLHSTYPRPDAVVLEPQLVTVRLSGLIKSMMSIEVEERPNIDEVLQTLQRELPLHEHTLPKAADIVLWKDPEYRSTDTVHPHFRMLKLKESLFIILLSIEEQNHAKYKLLVSILRRHFGTTFSFGEILGKWDFLVTVWSKRPIVESFGRQILAELPGLDEYAVRVFESDEVVMLGNVVRCVIADDDIPHVLVRIDEAQKGADRVRGEAKDWLRKRGVYLKDRPRSVDGSRVHCICLVSVGSHATQSEREAKFAAIVRAFETRLQQFKKMFVWLCRRTYRPLEGLNTEESGFLVIYSARAFSDVAVVPSLLLDDLQIHRLKVSTLVFSKRYYVDSDEVDVK